MNLFYEALAERLDDRERYEQERREPPHDEWDELDREREARCLLALSNCLLAGADADDLDTLARELHRAEAWEQYKRQERLL